MGLLGTADLRTSIAGEALRKVAEADAGGAPPDALGLDQREVSALAELERLGYVRLERGVGAQAWRIERVMITDAGRVRLAAP